MRIERLWLVLFVVLYAMSLWLLFMTWESKGAVFLQGSTTGESYAVDLNPPQSRGQLTRAVMEYASFRWNKDRQQWESWGLVRMEGVNAHGDSTTELLNIRQEPIQDPFLKQVLDSLADYYLGKVQP